MSVRQHTIDIIATSVVFVGFAALLGRALWKKEAIFGGPPGLVFARKDKPVRYWSLIGMLALAASVSLLMLTAQIKQTLIP